MSVAYLGLKAVPQCFYCGTTDLISKTCLCGMKTRGISGGETTISGMIVDLVVKEQTLIEGETTIRLQRENLVEDHE